ncbi:sirohydrochlorin chelatase [Oerskovia enterophila]|uniref:Sirohydrochlorin cobaltochelatase n=1 Tax=Oerskovia enterophila TaxID=43678 RepID=A0A163PYK8_9CELL|nr:CbiX/SirB N-terminal domain-containing protein [Oerskovia enterophila]KZM33639.1 sirohydrochlorin cobaltochelatase [Oerskovia enterophila]OCI32255.1 sirohydrochlorin cobaltochelatase [Oerskovia enterophila]
MSTEILGFPSGETEGSPSSGTAGAAGDPAAAPVLVGCSHGTNDVAGQAAIRALLDDVRATRPDLDVREAFVDVQQPEVADVVTHAVAPRAPGEGPGGQAGQAVVVPLLLSTGFHVNVDITEAVSPEHEGRGPEHGAATAARALGPDPRLAQILADRLAAAGTRPHDAVVLAAAGSSRSGAARDVEAVAEHLRAHHDGPVTVGFGAMATPSVRDAVAAAREALGVAAVPGEATTAPGGGADAAGAAPSGGEDEPPRVVIAAYLLAPGFFHDRLLEAGADVVTAPLAPDARLTAIVLDRYAEGVAALPAR